MTGASLTVVAVVAALAGALVDEWLRWRPWARARIAAVVDRARHPYPPRHGGSR